MLLQVVKNDPCSSKCDPTKPCNTCGPYKVQDGDDAAASLHCFSHTAMLCRFDACRQQQGHALL